MSIDERVGAAYTRGFGDGVNWVAGHIRLASNKIEENVYGDVESKATGKTYKAIIKSGNLHYARKLRELATELARIIDEQPIPPGT